MAIDPNIKQKAENIRLKKKGREVRESLAAGLEAMSEDVVETVDRQEYVEQQLQAVHDSTRGKDVISATEILASQVGADGTKYNNMKERLDAEQNKVNAQLAQNTHVLQGIDRTFGDRTFATVTELQTTYPTGDTKRYIVAADGKWYWWNGTVWVAGQVAQGIGIAAKSVKPPSTTFFVPSDKNLVESLIASSYINHIDGTISVSDTYALYSSTSFLSVLPESAYSVNKTVRTLAFYDSAKNFISGIQSGTSSTGIASPFHTPANASFIRATARHDVQSLGDMQIEKGTVSTPYEPYWLFNAPIKKGSIPGDALASDVSEGVPHEYIDTDGVIAGDSIVWNTGQVQNGETLIGYDGVLKRDLSLNSLQNIGVSGRPMANGTTNGVGTNTTVTTAEIDWLTKHFLVCNAGTNDFKLNVPIGTIQPFGNAFDTSTYIGAYQATIEYLLTKNSNLKIIIFTPAQRKNGGYTTESTNTAGHKLIDYVNAAKEVSQKYSALLVDIYTESGISEFTINEYTYDGLHLNNKGYEAGGGLAVKKMCYG